MHLAAGGGRTGAYEYMSPFPKASSLQHKLSVLLHMLKLETSSEAHLRSIMGAFRSGAFDMGTELGLAEHQSLDLQHVLLQTSSLGELVDDDGYPDNGSETSSFMFENMLPIPAMAHICHNLSSGLLDKMPHYSEWLKQLKHVARFLANGDARRRFSHFCLEGGPGAPFQRVFRNGIKQHVDWRWGLIVEELKPLLDDFMIPLRAFWDPGKFQQHARDGQRERTRTTDADTELNNSIAALTPIIKGTHFWIWGHALLEIEAMIHGLSDWSEGCPCHEALFVHKTRWFNEKAYNEELRAGSPNAHTCPNKGNRAPELAAGRAKLVFDEIADKSYSSIVVFATTLTAPPMEMESVLKEFDSMAAPTPPLCAHLPYVADIGGPKRARRALLGLEDGPEGPMVL
eukprot:9490813-Pyramimonas_sp.AAC.1